MIIHAVSALLAVVAHGTTPSPGDDEYTVAVEQSTPGTHGSNGHNSGPDPYEAYRWTLACSGDAADSPECLLAEACPEDEELYAQFGLKDGSWIALQTECRSDAEAAPTITPALVSHAFHRIPLPHLRAIAQPGTKTLVNFDTIFYVEAEPLERQLTLLGQRVELDITPSSFHWNWGDGNTDTTHTPGAPYPDKSVIHRYLDADTTVHARVTVTWTARWRVNGGAWADVPGSVRTTGPAATLRVVEAVPNLSGPD